MSFFHLVFNLKQTPFQSFLNCVLFIIIFHKIQLLFKFRSYGGFGRQPFLPRRNGACSIFIFTYSFVKYNSKYSMIKCNLKCLIFFRTILYFDELYKHFGSSLQKVRHWSSVKYIDLKSAHTHVFSLLFYRSWNGIKSHPHALETSVFHSQDGFFPLNFLFFYVDLFNFSVQFFCSIFLFKFFCPKSGQFYFWANFLVHNKMTPP